MSLSHIRQRAEAMRREFAAAPDRPATFRDLAEVYTAIEELAREASSVTDPRLFRPSERTTPSLPVRQNCCAERD